MNEFTLASHFKKLAVSFNHRARNEEDLIKIWKEEFRHVSDNQFQKAVSWCIQHIDRFPTIKQLRSAIGSVGGPGTGQKVEFYEWIDKGDFSTRPVSYYFVDSGHIYETYLTKKEGMDKPPEEVTYNEVTYIREDVFKKRKGDNWKVLSARGKDKVEVVRETPLKKDIEELKRELRKL